MNEEDQMAEASRQDACPREGENRLTGDQIRAEYERLERIDRLFAPLARALDAMSRWARRYGIRAEEFLAEHDYACHGNCVGCGTPLLTGDWVSFFYEDETLCQACAPTLADELAVIEGDRAEGTYADDPERMKVIEKAIAELTAIKLDGADMTKKELVMLE